MVSITLSVPQEMKEEMEKFPEINWSAVAREAIQNRMVLLQKFRTFSAQSSLTEQDAVRLGRKVNKELSKRYRSR